MAGTLKVKIQEDIILDNQDYGSKRVLEVASIASIVKRVVNIGTNEIGLLGFGAAYNTELSKSATIIIIQYVATFSNQLIMYFTVFCLLIDHKSKMCYEK